MRPPASDTLGRCAEVGAVRLAERGRSRDAERAGGGGATGNTSGPRNGGGARSSRLTCCL
jgi:hypothetical protein